MKSGLIMNIFVARALKELGLVSCPITLTFSPDEEIGSPSALPVLQGELKNALVSFCSEPGYVGNGVTIERKGSGHILLEITGKSSHAGRAYAEGASVCRSVKGSCRIRVLLKCFKNSQHLQYGT